MTELIPAWEIVNQCRELGFVSSLPPVILKFVWIMVGAFIVLTALVIYLMHQNKQLRKYKGGV